MFPPGYCPGKLGGTQLDITVSNLTLLCVNTDGLTYGFIFSPFLALVRYNLYHS